MQAGSTLEYKIDIMSYRNIITIEPDKRGGKPCIRRMRITVYDVLGWRFSWNVSC